MDDGKCVGITKAAAKGIELYKCPNCQENQELSNKLNISDDKIVRLLEEVSNKQIIIERQNDELTQLKNNIKLQKKKLEDNEKQKEDIEKNEHQKEDQKKITQKLKDEKQKTEKILKEVRMN